MTAGARDRGDDVAADSDPRPPQCPKCRALGRPGERFCLRCRCEFATGATLAPPKIVPFRGPALRATTQWEAHIDADPDYFASSQHGEIRFPTGVPTRVVILTDDRVVIGRRSRSEGIYPQVDLSVPTVDPGVSMVNAIIDRFPDGTLRLIDVGSYNGTRLNGDTTPIEPNNPVRLKDGDQIFVGAWSRITVRKVAL